MTASTIPWKSLVRNLVFLMLVLAPCAATHGQATPAKGIVLQRDWDSPVQEGDLVVNELSKLLSGSGGPAANLGPAPELDIYRGVKYLTPLKEAVKVLKIKSEVSAKHMVICPGLPYRTLVSYSFNYLDEAGFNEIHIVADKADQVVAIQLYAAQGRKVPADYLFSDPKYRMYDFINSRAKALTTAEVRHKTKGGSIVQMDSDFNDPTGRVNRFTRLFLPKPLVELILFRIEKIKARASGK